MLAAITAGLVLAVMAFKMAFEIAGLANLHGGKRVVGAIVFVVPAVLGLVGFQAAWQRGPASAHT